MKSPAPFARTAHKPAGSVRLAPALRRQQLHQRRADLVPEGFIADDAALDWLEWNGAALRITLAGENICKQMHALPK